MALTSEQLLNHLYYNKLPQIYRDMDKAQMTFPLKRYLSALIDGGYAELLKDTNNLMELVDPQKCPEKFLPMLCESFGLPYFNDIPAIYQRKFISNIGEINKRRGTYSCVTFLVRVLTGLDTELSYARTSNGRELDITLLAKTLQQLSEIDTSVSVIEKYIQTQIPYYITPRVNSRVESQTIASRTYRSSAIFTNTVYTLKTAT